MTAEDFRQKIRSIYRSDDRSNTVFIIVFIAMGLFLLVTFIVKRSSTVAPEPFGRWLIPFIPITFGCYTLWRMRQDYIVYTLNSTKSVQEKIDIIENYLTDVKIVWRYEEGNYRSITYRNKFFRKVDLRFYIDEKKVHFNAQGTDTYAKKGYIDFGLTRRAGKRLRRYLNANL